MVVSTDIETEFRPFDIQDNFIRLRHYLKLHKKKQEPQHSLLNPAKVLVKVPISFFVTK
jgi:hypothetical protein